MPSDVTYSPSTISPMLPPFHSLGLSPIREASDLSARETNEPEDLSRWHLRNRQSSTSFTDPSCTTSPSLTQGPRKQSPILARDTPTPPPGQVSANGFSLVLTSFDKANAFVVVPPSQPYVPGISSLSRANALALPSRPQPSQNRALLLVGPAVEHLRHSRVRFPSGTRIHPYRIISNARRHVSLSSKSRATLDAQDRRSYNI